MFFKAVVQERHGKLQKCFYKEAAILPKMTNILKGKLKFLLKESPGSQVR